MNIWSMVAKTVKDVIFFILKKHIFTLEHWHKAIFIPTSKVKKFVGELKEYDRD